MGFFFILHRGHLKMSEEGDVVMVEETPVAQETPVEEPMDIESALKEVLKRALVANGLGRGLRECQQALEKGKVHLRLLAADCNEPAYVSLITALCLENNVKLLKVKKAKSLGEWAGLRKLDRDNNPRKVVSASSVVITSYGEETKALQFLLNYIETNTEA